MCIEHREESWGELQVKAFRLLERTPPPSRELIFPVLRLWQFPSVTPYTSWTVFRTQQATVLAVREVTWIRLDDHKRLCSDLLEGLKKGFGTDPTVEMRDALLDATALNGFMEDANRIHLPVLRVDPRLGLE